MPHVGDLWLTMQLLLDTTQNHATFQVKAIHTLKKMQPYLCDFRKADKSFIFDKQIGIDNFFLSKIISIFFLKIKTCWSNAILIVLKICIATAYILVGYYSTIFNSYYVLVLIIFGIAVVCHCTYE